VPSDDVKLALSDVRVAVAVGAGVEAGLMVLREEAEPHRLLRIVIGQPEARAIMTSWSGSLPSRPSTWDLFVSAVAMLDARLDRAVITGVEEQRHFFAAVELERDGQRRVLACRPSDAVALAVRAFGAEIYAHEEVMAAAGVLADGSRPPPAPLPARRPRAEVGAPMVDDPTVADRPDGEPETRPDDGTIRDDIPPPVP